jgi:hypothetical protein
MAEEEWIIMNPNLQRLAKETKDPRLGKDGRVKSKKSILVVADANGRIKSYDDVSETWETLAHRDRMVRQIYIHNNKVCECDEHRWIIDVLGKTPYEAGNDNNAACEHKNKFYVAPGPRVYDWDGVNQGEIVKRDSEITALVSNGTDLFDSCETGKVFNTLSDELIVDFEKPVNSMVWCHGYLICAVGSKIYSVNTDTCEHRKVVERHAPIYALCMHEQCLLDAGRYSQIFTTGLKEIYASVEQSIMAMCSVPEELFRK